MASPTRSLSRLALTASLAVSLVVHAAPARAQEGVSLIRDTEIEETLRKDSVPLFEAAGVDSKSIRILLIGSKDLQASAGPGQMAVYTGLILETENPNQLQGVMAHEIGHLAGGHSARSGDMNSAGMRPFLLTMGLGVLAALAGSAEAAAGLVGSANYFGTLGAMGYSREQESRADQAGLTYLEKAGLSGRGLVKFFDNFRYQEVFQEARRFAYFRSHPLSSDRIEALRSRAQVLRHYDQKDSAEAMSEHAIMKMKLDAFINPQLVMGRLDEKDQSYTTRYGRAIAYY
ncbi:MAG: M48 family metalloprotease, partial [Phenylobacterium sp.]|nr:M48 family metalloprotease [Phenylobacterium sp.]MBP9232647.1 M48 family metalloprotease [Phenylobacterium sp.]